MRSRLLALITILAAVSGCSSGAARRAQERDAMIDQLSAELNTARQRAEALEGQLQTKDRDLESSRSESRQLREAAKRRDSETRRGADGVNGGPNAAEIASLRDELQKERERRQALEVELQRLKRETANPYGDGRVPEADYLALKQELVALRRTAEADREAREKLAAQVQALQSAGNALPAAVDDPQQRAALEKLQSEKEQIITNLNKSLAASQQRASALENEIVTLRQSSSSTDGTTLRAENSSLRTRLDDERRRTEDLEAKLRVAARVTDLIFRMQSQEGPAKNQKTRGRKTVAADEP
jgi:DNA repair exonuclease SbcCD ATPase subunit